MNRNLQPRSKQSGFSLIEVMVAMVIMGLALLGAAKLHLEAMRLGSDSRFDIYAGSKAQDLMDAIAYGSTSLDWNLNRGTASSNVPTTNPVLKSWVASLKDDADTNKTATPVLPKADAKVACTAGTATSTGSVLTTCAIDIYWTPGKKQSSVTTGIGITDERSAHYVVERVKL